MRPPRQCWRQRALPPRLAAADADAGRVLVQAVQHLKRSGCVSSDDDNGHSVQREQLGCPQFPTAASEHDVPRQGPLSRTTRQSSGRHEASMRRRRVARKAATSGDRARRSSVVRAQAQPASTTLEQRRRRSGRASATARNRSARQPAPVGPAREHVHGLSAPKSRRRRGLT